MTTIERIILDTDCDTVTVRPSMTLDEHVVVLIDEHDIQGEMIRSGLAILTVNQALDVAKAIIEVIRSFDEDVIV